MKVTGRLIEVVEEFEGSSVKGDVAAGATTIPLADLGDFAEDGLCLIAAAPYAFIVDEDAGAIIIDPPLSGAAGDGGPVYSLTWDSQLQSELVAVVDLLDDEAGIARAEIPVSMRPMYPTGQTLAGALVDLDTTESGYVVAGSPMRGLDIDATHTYMPAFAAAKGSDATLADSTWTFLGGWFKLKSDRVSMDIDGSLMTVQVDGVYDFRVGVTFAAAAGGYRAVRMRYYNPDGSEIGVSRQVRIPGSSVDDVSVTVVETAQYRTMFAGQSVRFEAWQSSNAPLAVRGSNVFTGPPLTDCAIRWVGPA